MKTQKNEKKRKKLRLCGILLLAPYQFADLVHQIHSMLLHFNSCTQTFQTLAKTAEAFNMISIYLYYPLFLFLRGFSWGRGERGRGEGEEGWEFQQNFTKCKRDWFKQSYRQEEQVNKYLKLTISPGKLPKPAKHRTVNQRIKVFQNNDQ